MDAHYFDLKELGNNQGNRLYLCFEGKERELEIFTTQDSEMVRIIRTSIAQFTAGFSAAALPRLDMTADRQQALIDPVTVGVGQGILDTYQAWCSYYGVAFNTYFCNFVGDVVQRGETDVLLHECPGIEANSAGKSLPLLPVLQSFAHNTHFNGLTLSGISRPEVFKCATTLFRGQNQRTLTKLVLRDTSGDVKDARVFFEEWGKSNARADNQLCHIDVSGNKLGDAAGAVADAIESLKRGVQILMFNDCGFNASNVSDIATSLTRNLASSLTLTTLCLDHAKFDQDANDSFAFWLGCARSCGALRKLSLRNCPGLEFASAFRPLVQGSTHNIQYLDLSQNKVDAAFLATQVIRSAQALQTLKLSECGLSSELFDVIGKALGANEVLIHGVEFVVSGNPALGSNAAAVQGCVQKCTNVTKLDLRSCGFSFAGAQLVLDCIVTLMPQLESFFIGGVGIGELKKPSPNTHTQMMGFATAASRIIGIHPRIYEFGLDAISLNAKGWREIFSTMNKTRVSRFVLLGAVMGDVGMAALCEALRQNGSITSLEVDGNNFSLNGLLDLRATMRLQRYISHMPLPVADIQGILAKSGKPGSSAWAEVHTIAQEIAKVVGINASNNGVSPWSADTSYVAPVAEPPSLVQVPGDLIRQDEIPPRYRDKKEWQVWKSTKMETKLQDYTRAAVAGGYIAGSLTSGGMEQPPPPRGESPRRNARPMSQFGTATAKLLADLDMGDGGYDDQPPPPPPGDDYSAYDYGDGDETISSRRVPPPPPSDEYY